MIQNNITGSNKKFSPVRKASQYNSPELKGSSHSLLKSKLKIVPKRAQSQMYCNIGSSSKPKSSKIAEFGSF